MIVPTLQRGNVLLTLQRHLGRAWQRLGQPRIHRKHLVALNKTGRWSVQGRVPTLERGNEQKSCLDDMGSIGTYPENTGEKR